MTTVVVSQCHPPGMSRFGHRAPSVVLRSYLSGRGVDLSGEQQTKTRRPLSSSRARSRSSPRRRVHEEGPVFEIHVRGAVPADADALSRLLVGSRFLISEGRATQRCSTAAHATTPIESGTSSTGHCRRQEPPPRPASFRSPTRGRRTVSAAPRSRRHVSLAHTYSTGESLDSRTSSRSRRA